MRIFLFFILLLIGGCSTVEVTKEVIKVKNTVTNKVKESIPKKENEEENVFEEIIEEKEIEKEIEVIEEKQNIEKNIIENQQKIVDINFIGKTENKIFNLLGVANLSRVDGAVYTLRYDSDNCRLFLFFKQGMKNKRVEYFEMRDQTGKLIKDKISIQNCYKNFDLNL